MQAHFYPIFRPFLQLNSIMKRGLLVQFPGLVLHCPTTPAANQGSTVELLLKCGADVSFKDSFSWTPLHFTSARGCVSALQVLLKYDTAREAQACFAVGTTASSIGRLGFCQFVLQITNRFILGKCTPLYMAAAFSALETVTKLVDHGANTNLKAQYGLALLHALHSRTAQNILALSEK